MSTHSIHLQDKKENLPKLSVFGGNPCGLKNVFDSSMVNEPLGFEPLKFHCTYIWYTDSSYGRCSSKIISSIMSSSLPPPPFHPPPPPPPTHTHIHTHTLTNYDQDFKVIVLVFFWMTSTSSGKLSCLATNLVYNGDDFVTSFPLYKVPSENGSTLKGKNLLPLGAYSFLFCLREQILSGLL